MYLAWGFIFKREYRKNGRSTEFFAFLEKEYKGAVRFKLEVEEENEAAVAAYIKNGYSISGYKVMTKEMDEESLPQSMAVKEIPPRAMLSAGW